MNRIILVGKNKHFPKASRFVACRTCSGDGWVYGWNGNPSDLPKVTCPDCDGQGAIERSAK